MITKEELLDLLQSTETYRIEKTVSTTNKDKFSEAICAFANDMPNSRKPGYLLIGVDDNGRRSGLKVTDALLKNIASIRTEGNILPFPVMNVDYVSFDDGDVLIVEVFPSEFPPVRYHGRTYIRIGPRKDKATTQEESMLVERRSANFPTFDTTPCVEATLDDIDTKLFLNEYLPKAIDEEVLRADTRSVKEQLASLRLYSMKHDCPTYAAIILFGKNPKYFLFGDYVQYVHFEGLNNAAPILRQKEFEGNLMTLLPRIDLFIEDSLIVARPVLVTNLREELVRNYPKWAVRELMMNALMHRDYKTNTPTKLYQYADRLEITNAGGLYGNARPENFPNVNDYRNPIVAEALRVLGYVNKFNRGISMVQEELQENGNDRAVFDVSKITVFSVIVNVNEKSNLESDQKTSTKNDQKEETTPMGEKTTTIDEKTSPKNAQKSTQKSIQKDAQKNAQKLMEVLVDNPLATRGEIATILGISEDAVKWQITKLKRAGVLQREGGRKLGKWIIVK